MRGNVVAPPERQRSEGVIINLTCKECGKIFTGTKVTQARKYCDECRKEKHNKRVLRYYHERVSRPQFHVKVPRIIQCSDCGKEIEGKPGQKYCPECRAIRNKFYQRKYPKEDYVEGAAGKLLVRKKCAVCGSRFIGNYNARYCENCKPYRLAIRIGKTQKEDAKRELATLIRNIEDPKNYYAMFGRMLESCAIARDRNVRLFDMGVVSNEEFLYNVQRIGDARNKAITAHGEWLISFLKRTKTRHTVRTLVSSIYCDIFGTEFASEFLKNSELNGEKDMERKEMHVEFPDDVQTSEDETEYLLKEVGIGRIDFAEDVPSDEECESIYEIVLNQQRR